MEPKTLSYSGVLTVVTCWCGMRHAVPAELREFQERQHRDGRPQQDIYCPLGHGHIIAGDGAAARLQRELTQAQDALARSEAQVRTAQRESRSAQREVKRITRRAAAGVCPYCHRSIASARMVAHVAAKHPEHTERKP